jgi:DNA replication and repair protein RecF
MKQFASQGQKKSGLLALKLAQYHYLTQNLKYKPILLLDDIFEKLDQFRLSALMQLIDNHSIGQVIITDTHEDRVKATFGAQKEIGLIHLPLS